MNNELVVKGLGIRDLGDLEVKDFRVRGEGLMG